MNSRIFICALTLCAGGLGFAVGYSRPRNSHDNPASKQLLSLADKIAADVAGIQRTLARDDARCATSPVTKSSAALPAERMTNKESTESPDRARLHTEAEMIVSRGVSSGRWTEKDARELRDAINELSGDEKQAVVAPLLQAINAQQVKLDSVSIL